MKNKIYSLIFTGLVLSLIHCGNGSNGDTGNPPFDLPGGGPNIDEAPVPDENGVGVTHDAAEIKLVTPADDSLDVSANTIVSVEFTAPATEVEIHAMHLRNGNDVFNPVQGTSGYNVQTLTAVFAADGGLQTDQHYIFTVTWKSQPDDSEKQEFVWNFSTVMTVDVPGGGSFGPILTPTLITPTLDLSKFNLAEGVQEQISQNAQAATGINGVNIPKLIDKNLFDVKLDPAKFQTGCPSPIAYCLPEEFKPGEPYTMPPSNTYPVYPTVDPVNEF